MYKLLLCWRYLLTRYLALACIVSVMLGVATLIVVNSVMGGFSTKLKDRLHGLLSDVLIEANSFDGFADPEGKMAKIRASAIGDKIEAMTPTLEVFCIMQFRVPDARFSFRDQMMTKTVHMIGIEPEGRERVGGFARYLRNQHDEQATPSFQLDREARQRMELRQRPQARLPALAPPQTSDEPPPPEPPPSRVKVPEGIIIGHAIAHIRFKDPELEKVVDYPVLHPGDPVIITTVSGQKLAPVFDRFVVCSYFKSEMSEYDSNYVFVPLAYLQKLRTMEDRVSSIQIKLKDFADAPAVVAALNEMFPDLRVDTWEKKQGALLAAIDIERGLLNVLLFLIICVAGFGILAIFAMIVIEKTRDIGILKALGASNAGVMKIFLGYGLLLGMVGAGLGTALGIAFTVYINEIEAFLSKVTHREIFDRSVYYFKDIPTDIRLANVIWIVVGSVGIAVLFSVLPALRAALLHPVRALRYE